MVLKVGNDGGGMAGLLSVVLLFEIQFYTCIR